MSENETSISGIRKVDLPNLDQPAPYRICVRGDLDEQWSDRLGGLKIRKQTQEGDIVITLLEGRLQDQAALVGVLVALYNNRLPLISVECLETVENEEGGNFEVSFKQNPGYLEFIVTGIYDLDEAIGKFPLLIKACRHSGISNVLIDSRDLVGEQMLTEELLYASQARQLYQSYLSGGGQPLKIAFVSKKTLSEDLSEAISQIQGLDAFVTRDYKQAVEWLFDENTMEK